MAPVPPSSAALLSLLVAAPPAADAAPHAKKPRCSAEAWANSCLRGALLLSSTKMMCHASVSLGFTPQGGIPFRWRDAAEPAHMKTSPTDTSGAPTANASEEALVERRASTSNV